MNDVYGYLHRNELCDECEFAFLVENKTENGASFKRECKIGATPVKNHMYVKNNSIMIHLHCPELKVKKESVGWTT